MYSSTKNYDNKTVYVATMHQKEEVIRPAFEKALGCVVQSTKGFDTDTFGTFSGELERKLPFFETCVAKAKAASKAYGFDCVISSEGSFGPHPTLAFMPADIELLVFFDAEKDIVISEQLISTETNYAHLDLLQEAAYEEFLQKVQFPSHQLILKDVDANTVIAKGVNDCDQLTALIKGHRADNKTLRLETDMRAMCNPTRLRHIEKLAQQLAARVSQECPACACPGFGRVELRGHLTCQECGLDTALYKNKVLQCVECDFEVVGERDDGLRFSQPQHCLFCNP